MISIDISWMSFSTGWSRLIQPSCTLFHCTQRMAMMAISFFFTRARIQQVSGLGFRSYIIFRPQVLAWPEIIWSVTLLGINLVRWVIFDSVSFIFLWRRYPSKCQKGETKLSVSSPEEVGQQFATIMGRIIKELSYNETVELDGSPWSTSFVDFRHNCARIQNIFTQNVYSIKINFSWLRGWDAFKTWYLASSKVEPACYKQSQLHPKTVGVHLSRTRRLLRIHFQPTD